MKCSVIVFLVLGCLIDHVVAEEQRSAVAEENELDAGVRVRVATADADKITGARREAHSSYACDQARRRVSLAIPTDQRVDKDRDKPRPP